MEVTKAVDVYKQFAKYPQPVSACVSLSAISDHFVIDTVQAQRDLERSEKIRFSRSYLVKQTGDGKFSVLHRSNAQEINNEIWNKDSPSGKYMAIVRRVIDKKKSEKQYVEIWEGNRKIENFDITAADKHGKLYDPDLVFGCFEWSHEENALLYVAEKKYEKPVSFFAKTNSEDGSTKSQQGNEYVVKEEWGEMLAGKHIPVLCVLTISSGEITVLEGVPENVSAGLARWLPGDEKIVFTGWDHEPYRLGIIYCPIRKGTLYILDLKSNKCSPITPSDRASRSPILSPDGKNIVFLDINIGGPHMQCSRLLKYYLDTGITSTVIEEIQSASGDEFPGLFCINLPDQCWSEDGLRVVINTVWKHSNSVVVINTETGEITRLPSECGGDITLLTIADDIIVARCASPNKPHYLIVGKLPAKGKEKEILWSCIDDKSVVLENISWKIVKHVPTGDRIHPKYASLDYESILVYKSTQKEEEKTNLLVFPHGGPHTAFTTDFSLYVSYLCELEFSVLMVNYRGSAGYGMDSIRSVLERIGDQDVKDVQTAAEEVLATEGYDKDRVCVSGGSHGGFLTCHLVAQYPDFYKAAMSRNGVFNVTTMPGVTDIPDCIYAEIGYEFDIKALPDVKACELMWKCSPLQYVDQITCPMLILIGLEDKRVPIYQSFELYRALKARNKPVKFLGYPENDHPITRVDAEADAFLNTYKWFMENLPA